MSPRLFNSSFAVFSFSFSFIHTWSVDIDPTRLALQHRELHSSCFLLSHLKTLSKRSEHCSECYMRTLCFISHHVKTNSPACTNETRNLRVYVSDMMMCGLWTCQPVTDRTVSDCVSVSSRQQDFHLSSVLLSETFSSSSGRLWSSRLCCCFRFHTTGIWDTAPEHWAFTNTTDNIILISFTLNTLAFLNRDLQYMVKISASVHVEV